MEALPKGEIMKRLKDRMESLLEGGMCIAFSGGVDSSLLLKVACLVGAKHGQTVHAVTFSTKLHPVGDLEIAKKICKEVGAKHHIIQINELNNPLICNNPVDRCYHCKKYLFTQLLSFAKEHGLRHVIEGSNADDKLVYRPGMRAIAELGIISPLLELDITKAKVRAYAEALGLSVAKRPSAPCMATRLPYGTQLDFSLLERLEKGEAYLQSLGFAINRLRLHGEIIRVEIETSAFSQFLAQKEEICKTLQALGFRYITLDLEGFRSGSMDAYL